MKKRKKCVFRFFYVYIFALLAKTILVTKIKTERIIQNAGNYDKGSRNA